MRKDSDGPDSYPDQEGIDGKEFGRKKVEILFCFGFGFGRET